MKLKRLLTYSNICHKIEQEWYRLVRNWHLKLGQEIKIVSAEPLLSPFCVLYCAYFCVSLGVNSKARIFCRPASTLTLNWPTFLIGQSKFIKCLIPDVISYRLFLIRSIRHFKSNSKQNQKWKHDLHTRRDHKKISIYLLAYLLHFSRWKNKNGMVHSIYRYYLSGIGW